MGIAEVHSIALYYLTREANIIFDQTGSLFDSYAYSRFKYGSRSMATHYGKAMQQLLFQKFPQLLDVPTFWLTSSAYKFVPTASEGLAKAFKSSQPQRGAKALSFGEVLGKASLGHLVKIGRSKLFPADYGNLSQSERQAIMQQVDLFFEHENSLSIEHKNSLPASKPEDLVIVDDIRITGAHENRLLEFAEREGFKRVYFVYIAHLSPKAEPTTEHWLNHTAIRDLRDLWDLWREEGCLLNARICKFLLSYPHTKSLARFAEALPTRLSTKIAQGMWADGYADMEMYAKNWNIWKNYQLVDVMA